MTITFAEKREGPRILTFNLDDVLTYSALAAEGIDEDALMAAATEIEKYRQELEREPRGFSLSPDWEELL